MNNVVLSGRMVADPVLRTTPSGNSMATFTIAVRGNSNKEGTDRVHFLDCVTFLKLAETIVKHVTKGEKITVMGSLNQRTYEGQDGKNHNVVEVFVREAEFQLKLIEGEADAHEDEPKGKKSKR